MKEKVFRFIFLLALIGSNSKSFSQNDKNERRNLFISERINTKMPPLGKWKTSVGSYYDFNTINKPTFLRLGFSSCSPCVVEMPYFVEFAINYPSVDFIYLTYEDFNLINHELELLNLNKLPQNLYFISMKRTYIDGYKLTHGWPVNYFINKEGIVKHIYTGGVGKCSDSTRNRFSRGISQIIN